MKIKIKLIEFVAKFYGIAICLLFTTIRDSSLCRNVVGNHHYNCFKRPLVDVVVFFFQAEDGIRDIGVTGVQTCALPIF